MSEKLSMQVLDSLIRCRDLNDGGEVNIHALRMMHAEFTGRLLTSKELDDALTVLFEKGLATCRLGVLGLALLSPTPLGYREHSVRQLLLSV